MTLSFDNFPQADSVVHRLDPRWKLASLVPAVIAIVLVKTLPAALACLGCTFLLVILSHLPLSWYVRRLGALSLFLALFVLTATFLIKDHGPSLQIGPISASFAGLVFGVMTLAKALAIGTFVLVLLATGPLDATFKAAHALYVPGLLVQLVMMMYRYVFVFAGELLRMRVAMRVRGYRNRFNRHSYRTIGHVAGTLLVRGYERSERVGQAMRCRGFDGRFRSLVSFRTTARDILALGLVLAVSAALLTLDWCWYRA